MSAWLTKGQTESIAKALKNKYGREFAGTRAVYDGMLSHAQASGGRPPDNLDENRAIVRVPDTALKYWADVALRESFNE